jgi:hypothetical protein
MKRFYCIARGLFPVLLMSFLIISCRGKDDIVPLDSQKLIVTFKIDTILGQIDETNHTVTITVPGTTDLAHVKPVIAISKNAIVSPLSGTEVDLSKPVIYTVTAQDQSKQSYVVTTKKAVNLQNRISSFEIKSGAYTYKGVINDTTFTVKVGAPFTATGYVNPSKVLTSVTIPAGATIEPAADAVVDFTSPVKYKVTAPNGEMQEYTVSVLNKETDFTYFDVPLSSFVEGDLRKPKIARTGTESGLWAEEVIGLTAPFAIFHVLESEDVSNLPIKNVKLSQGATISPAADVPQNFNKDVTYTVTSQYGNTEQYTIRAFKKKIIMWSEFAPTSLLINGAAGNLEEYISDQDIKAAWLLGSDNIEYGVTVEPATRYAWGYVTTHFYANTATLPRGLYWLKVKLTNDAVVSVTHRFYSY